jgi:hypothetical protein
MMDIEGGGSMSKWEYCYLMDGMVKCIFRSGQEKVIMALPPRPEAFIQRLMILAMELSEDGWEMFAVDWKTEQATFKRPIDDGPVSSAFLRSREN